MGGLEPHSSQLDKDIRYSELSSALLDLSANVLEVRGARKLVVRKHQ